MREKNKKNDESFKNLTQKEKRENTNLAMGFPSRGCEKKKDLWRPTEF